MKYFKWSEFDSPDAPGSGYERMDRDFIQKLDIARHISGVPYQITSGYRTHEHNIEVGGVADSSHRKGLAVDISAVHSRTRYKVLMGLIRAGFTRIGIGKTFIHVDDDRSKPPEVVWLY